MGRPDTLRRLGDLARAVAYRQALIRHERWSRPRLEKFQYRQLTRLLDWVTHKSPFYLKLCQTLNISKPFDLQDFPIMDKQAHMQHFDQLVTDPRLRLSQIHDHLACLSSDEYYLGEYRALTTAGSSGHRAVFVSNRKEWSLQQAASMRIAAMMGIFPCSVKRPRIVTTGSPSPLHDSYRLPLSMDIGLYHYHMLPATTPVVELVWKLNTLKPDLLRGSLPCSGYWPPNSFKAT